MARRIHKLLQASLKLQQRQCLVRDRVLRILPIEATHAVLAASTNPGVLYFELVRLAHIQLALSLEGCHLAGVVTVGDVLDVPDVFVGPGVTRAERLCDEWTSAPRLVIDPDLLRQLAANPHLRDDSNPISEEHEAVRDLLARGPEGLWYLDYLWACWTPGQAEKAYGEALHKHKEVLARSLAAPKTTRRLAVQLNWLRRYHNSTIRQLVKQAKDGLVAGLHKDELLVPVRGPIEYRF